MEERSRFGFVNSNTSAPKYAYGFFAVTKAHFIAALVNIERLKKKRLSDSGQYTHVDFVILTNIKLSQRKIDLLEDIKLRTYPKLPSPKGYYYESMVKLLFYNMTEYYRIIYMDIDALVLKPLDELFNLPASVSLASPVAYWENELCFTSALLVIKPNHKTWLELLSRMDEMYDGFRSGRTNACMLCMWERVSTQEELYRL
ncbi:uncharacterized protein LOC123525607 [Mercenaria mercenaria]|uniref:uncharacterized protein LOC123525607 n=1 Tax=Mercenaria mercenaria TaxID=6596 RepID=UPI00234E7E8D|nr:uncharacterized protein LOC123525607 [Mercenaria mercenaria]